MIVVVGGGGWEEVVGDLAVGGLEVGGRPQAKSRLGYVFYLRHFILLAAFKNIYLISFGL